MKSLKNLNGIKKLNKSELKMIAGGSYRCQCTGSVGSWIGDYSSSRQALRAISRNCSSGAGYCVGSPSAE